MCRYIGKTFINPLYFLYIFKIPQYMYSNRKNDQNPQKMVSLTSKAILGLGLRGTQTPPAAAQILPRPFNARVIEHYNPPSNVRSLEKNDPTVGTGLGGAPAYVDVKKLPIKVDDLYRMVEYHLSKVVEIGSCDIISYYGPEWMKGRQMEEVCIIKSTARTKDAIMAAIKDYKAKRGKLGANAEASPAEKAAGA